jgi:two-component system NtrC family sensor kinase
MLNTGIYRRALSRGAAGKQLRRAVAVKRGIECLQFDHTLRRLSWSPRKLGAWIRDLKTVKVPFTNCGIFLSCLQVLEALAKVLHPWHIRLENAAGQPALFRKISGWGDKVIQNKKKKFLSSDALPYNDAHYREWRRRQVARMSITYLAPLVVLIFYFQYRYTGIEADSRRMQLEAIAEHQANTLDLFLTERRMNLANLIDHPKFSLPPSSRDMDEYLTDLKRRSGAFIDLGFIDSAGVQIAYAGPHQTLELQNYRNEDWYNALLRSGENFVITDIYPGFRKQLHFTIAVSRIYGDGRIVLRATLDPARIYEYIRDSHATGDAMTCLVNKERRYQLVDERIGQPLERCPVPVSLERESGNGTAAIGKASRPYAFRWLRNAEWCLIVLASEDSGGVFSRLQAPSLIVSAALLLVGIVIVLYRSKKVTDQQKHADQTRAQLEHASKLASVGELAAGIAHEINNPLGIITVETGLLMDYTDPQFGLNLDKDELRSRLMTIQDSAFRCRDIARKLLRFVRKSDFDLQKHDIHTLIDGVIVGLLGTQIGMSDMEVVREYAPSLPQILTDGNQLQQVLLNFFNNARDAIAGREGRIVVSTSQRGDRIVVAVQDNGCGMTPEVLNKLFVPFFTTKEVSPGWGDRGGERSRRREHIPAGSADRP